MERFARVAALWSWLPGFRAVAETESIHEAARKLEVSPSSLSRTIALLEGALGRALFERGGRALHLTPLGEALLAQVRDAMRAIDDATAPQADVVTIAAPADLLAVRVLPMLARLRAEGTPLRARVTRDVDDDPRGRLLRGELDVVVACASLDDRHVVSTAIGAIEIGIYAAGGDGSTGFVAYHARGGPLDAWRDRDPRTIVLEVDDPRDAAAAAAASGLAVALPDRLVAQLGLPLRRIAAAPISPVEVFASRRRSLGPVHAADAIVAALGAVS